MINFYPHQINGLKETQSLNRVAYYYDMGLGKTYVGAEKMHNLGSRINLIVCQKSKVQDWINHCFNNYDDWIVYDGTKKKCLQRFFDYNGEAKQVIVINYDLIFRRPELKQLSNFTLMLDESSLIQNEQAKRSKFILKLQPKNVILLSGTPTGGKYEKLWSQLHLLNWNISKKMFYDQYIDFHWDDSNGFPLMVIDGYKNEERLKRKMREHGCRFLKTEEVLDLPQQINQTINIETTKEYKKFCKNSIIEFDGIELVGDTTLTKMLYQRQLCGQYNQDKLCAFQELLESTEDRVIVFYNFNAELDELMNLADGVNKPISVINGKEKELECYDEYDNSVTFAQYQAGSFGLNLQKANKVIYFSPPLSSELFEQSKKRIHRINQTKPCFYYYLICKNSVEEKIYKTLEMRKDYTDKLFEQEYCTKENV